jgi:hypothetical protein
VKWPPNEAGGIGTAALRRLTSTKRLRASAQEINETFGPPELCTWRCSPGICRFQTTLPQFARKLTQRGRAKLVGWSVNGGYLRIFQEKIILWRARNLVTRYFTAANGAFSTLISGPAASKSPRRLMTADMMVRCGLSDHATENTPCPGDWPLTFLGSTEFWPRVRQRKTKEE